jgi:DNA helicase-2/ATP-dependent DNA helicase PcrA
VLIGRVREHKGKEMLYAKDIIAFIDFHKRYSISIRNVVRTKEGEGSVVLMTAHKAKGLEFDTVFLLHVNDEVWVPKREGGGVSIAHPLNLPFSAEKNTEDDHLRLFYVALTRAKSSLYLTNHQFNEKGKETPVLRFQSGENQKSIAMEEASSDAVTEEWYNLHSAEKTTEEHTLLASLVENYQMSVTHFNTFLNVAKGGPEYFMTHNLLRFPEAKSVTSTFGTCIHAALQRWYVEYKQTKTPPSAEKLQEFFLERIKEERLTEKEKKEYGEKGATCLARYFEGALQTADPEDIPEADFTHQGVLIEEAHLTGKIDRLHLDKEEKKAVVTDFKTGAVLHKWTPSEDYAKQKVWGYKNQLLFYKLLVEGSRTYNTYTVDEGILAFVEGKEKEEMELRLRMEREEVEQLKKLIGIVYKKITTLDFPDVSKYEKNMKGIESFVKDLLEGKI